MGGAFQTSRDIFNNPIWQDIPKFRIFFFIVGNAVFSHEGIKIGNILVNRGQFLRSYRNLADDLQYIENRSIKKYSISVISRKIDQLVKEERLKIEDTELGTLFTVVNYDIYQGFDHYKKQELGTELEQCWNSDGTELEQKRNNNKKVNKEKKEKKDNKVIKNKYAESVSLTTEEYQKLLDENGEYLTQKMIEVLDNYKGASGKTYKSDYKAILSWVKDKVHKEALNSRNQSKKEVPRAYQSLQDWADEDESQRDY
jgi:hypothetical protein